MRDVTVMPGGAEVARLVSQVMEPMLGLTFTAVSEPPSDVGPTWKTAVLRIDGSRPLTVSVSADQTSGRALGARLFRTATEHVDGAAVEDALCEIVNLTAGLLKSALRIDHALGLPSIRDGAVFDARDAGWSHYLLRAAEMNVVLAVARRVS